jgi:hypothetical protein
MQNAATALFVPALDDLCTLEDRITELAAHITAATWALLEMIREFDERGGWEGPGLMSCAHWLNWKIGINLGAAREKVRVARAIKHLPHISEQFRLGQVSYSKVRAMTRVATPENETYLLMIATHGTASHVERLVRQYRQVKRIEALDQANMRHRMRELSWYYDEDDCLVVRGRFPPEQGAAIIQAMEAAQEEIFQEHKDVSAATPEELEDPVAARRADALERVADAFLTGNTSHRTGGDRYQVQVHTDIDTLKENGDGPVAELECGHHISAETSRRMACDCSVLHLAKNSEGEVLNVGRKTRSIPPAIRRALKARDGACRFPGCTCTRFTDAHHVKHWADGGETKLSNLVTLCHFHHRLVHEGGFGVQAGMDGDFQFTDAHQVVIPTAPRSTFRGNVTELINRNRDGQLNINPGTPIPYWLGERMDDGMAVEALLSLE